MQCTMSVPFTCTLLLLPLLGLTSCCPPPLSYDCSAQIIEKRDDLYGQIIALLPMEQQRLPEAQEEAKWLCDTAQLASAAIARFNDSCYANWSGNILINMNMQDRGLCWHYQQDMHRELRRRKLHFFRLGTCVRDAKTVREHNCNYIAALGGQWPQAIMLDAWIGNGILSVTPAWELSPKRWEDSPKMTVFLNSALIEEHQFEMETWVQVKTPQGDYACFWTNEARRSEQYARMYQNIIKGKKEHPGKLTSYDR